MHWSVFFIRTLTTDPLQYYDAQPDSGYSVDNLEPGVPTGFAVAYGSGSNALSWDPSLAADFAYFNVYRGSTPGFTAGPGNRVMQTTGTGWVDGSGSAGDYYQVTAVDFSGNESAPAGKDAASGLPGLPAAYALHAASPNPFNPMTVIRFDLPRDTGRVTLTVFDARGRLVDRLVEGALTAGSHEVTWTGRDQAGNAVGSGVYFYRLEAEDFTRTRKMLLVQ